jgi:hypothetical protein
VDRLPRSYDDFLIYLIIDAPYILSPILLYIGLKFDIGQPGQWKDFSLPFRPIEATEAIEIPSH